MSAPKVMWTALLAASSAMAAVNCDFRDGAAPSPTSFFVLCENATVLATNDGGRTWTSYTTGKEAPLLAITFLDANRGLIAGDNGVVLATKDGGKHWQPRSTNVTKALRAISVVGDSVWIAGDGGVILHSSDAGRTWIPQNSGITLGLEAIYFSDAQHGWAVGWIGSILRTVNGGRKWEPVQSQAASWSLSSVYFQDAKTGGRSASMDRYWPVMTAVQRGRNRQAPRKAGSHRFASSSPARDGLQRARAFLRQIMEARPGSPMPRRTAVFRTGWFR